MNRLASPALVDKSDESLRLCDRVVAETEFGALALWLAIVSWLVSLRCSSSVSVSVEGVRVALDGDVWRRTRVYAKTPLDGPALTVCGVCNVNSDGQCMKKQFDIASTTTVLVAVKIENKASS